MKSQHRATCLALLAAALYAINIPLSKLLLAQVSPGMMAAFLYLGAGLGLFLLSRLPGRRAPEAPLTRRELPYTLGMIVLDIAAPLLLMLGLERTNAANASLLNNFEIVATALLARFVFRETLSRRLAAALVLVSAASVLLSFEGRSSLDFNLGSLYVLGAACCWGLENNCTRMLSSKSSVQITTIKGCFSGLGSFLVALLLREPLPALPALLLVLLLGFVAYGLSINFYIRAQKELGAAKTSAYYSVAPFLGVALGLLLGQAPTLPFYGGLLLMCAATVLLVKDTVTLQHTHEHCHVHTHEHRHGDVVHTHEHVHVHTHLHVHGPDEGVHEHSHPQPHPEQHSHVHSA